uniref:RCC1 domain containing 1 n=1 Tax=Callithrix jacchus TaxID=9483 RepID=A0A5F4WJ88_CALJA
QFPHFTDKAAPAPGRPETSPRATSGPATTRWRPAEGAAGTWRRSRAGAWFGFGFCGFGKVPGSGRGRQVHSPEPLQEGVDIRRVSASWSYTAFVTREHSPPRPCLLQPSSRTPLCTTAASPGCFSSSGRQPHILVWSPFPPPFCTRPFSNLDQPPSAAPSFRSLGHSPSPPQPALWSAGGGRLELWAQLAAQREAAGTPGPRRSSSWCPGRGRYCRPGRRARPCSGEPLWAQDMVPEAEGEGDPGGEAQAGRLPLLPSARAYVSPRPPSTGLWLRSCGCASWSWARSTHCCWMRWARCSPGAGAETGDIYIWGWNESGQLALPTRSLAEDGETVAREATGLNADGSQVKRMAGAEDGAPAPFIAVQPFPALLDLPLGSDAIKASCGSRHTAVVTRTGDLYTWGWGKYGQLGREDTSSWDRPRRVEYFVHKQLQVKAITCGPWNTYVYAVEKGKS